MRNKFEQVSLDDVRVMKKTNKGKVDVSDFKRGLNLAN
jgi:hypothetical protein